MNASYTLTLLISLHVSLAIAASRYNPEAARLYDAGLRALTFGEQEKARATLEKAVALDASLADAHCVLGLIYSGFEKYRDAAEAFQHAVSADENYIEAYCELGDVLLIQLGDIPKAKAVLQKAIAMDENHAPRAGKRTLLGIAHFRENSTDAAVQELQKAVTLNPTSQTARYLHGALHCYSFASEGGVDFSY